jgi:NAD(P)H-hydrate epimerase
VVSAAVTRLPECCLCPCKEGAQGGIAPENVPLLRRQKATVLLLGPGLGGTAQSAARATETRTLVQQLLPGFAGAAVLDADGLNAAAQLLAEGKPFPHPAGELVVTPHPGEMARLTGLPAAALAADREGIALRYAKAWNAVVVLKGARTVVASPDGRVCVNPTGNPGLARGGSGDVLAGLIAGLLAAGLGQGRSPEDAAIAAVWLHGAAADRCANRRSMTAMLPTDIFADLGELLAEMEM